SSCRSHWLIAETCSRLSVRKRSAYWEASMRVERWALSVVRLSAFSRRSTLHARRSTLSEYSLNRLENPRRLEWLHDEVLRARLDRLDDECLLAHGRAHENPRRRIELADFAHRVDAAHIRHNDVHRYEVGL